MVYFIICFILLNKEVNAYTCCSSSAPCSVGFNCNNCGNVSCACDSGTICVPDNPVPQPTWTCASYGQQCPNNARCCSNFCYANTCLNPPTQQPGQPTFTPAPKQNPYCPWYTNADYCYMAGGIMNYLFKTTRDSNLLNCKRASASLN